LGIFASTIILIELSRVSIFKSDHGVPITVTGARENRGRQEEGLPPEYMKTGINAMPEFCG
jgi:hypothetical protein